jgi:peptide-methionine (R)-S-oxide reductase
MNYLIYFIGFLTLCTLSVNCQNPKINNEPKMDKIVKNDDEWRKILTPVQYNVTRESGTEQPFTGKYDNFFEKGTYICVCCGAVLFDSGTKFHSGCGWPSFYDMKDNKNFILKQDLSHGMVRTEVRCAKCNAHLGHVFDDGPKPTGLRYCINSASLEFLKKVK